MKIHLILTEEGGIRIFLRPEQGPRQKKELEALKWFLKENQIETSADSPKEISLLLSGDPPGCVGDVSGIELHTRRFGVGKFSMFGDVPFERVRIPRLKTKKKD